MNKKDILTVFTIALLGTVTILWFTDNSESAAARDTNLTQQNGGVAVEVIRPTVKTVADHLPYLGTVAGTKDGTLSFRIGGTLNEIKVEEGENVKQGMVLATVSVPELDAQRRRAKSEFKKAQSSKVFWEREVTTDSTLYEEGAISQTAFNKTAFNYEQALSGYYAAEAALDEIQERIAQTQLEAPANGRIGSIMIREGSNIGPNQPVFFFHQGQPVIYADVLEQDFRKGIKEGSTVMADIKNKMVTGSVDRIDYQAKPPFRSVRVFASFPDSALASRPPGAGISLTFEVNRQEDALLVPVSSVDLRGDTPRLFKVNHQMKAEAVPVDLGIQRGEYRQVKGNVSPTDRIISSGVNNVESGQRVEIARELTSNNIN
ncbi:efflux RND transporter periplasmic adaptor subunit [Halalkalibaculum sp. DA3122]|uniref:efflux RND transporter periplasmic adaptor subunit n=1 Tax=Halalkalibaculum sp. DA3122 TaxID=3373607 RepID=UPI0037544D21